MAFNLERIYVALNFHSKKWKKKMLIHLHGLKTVSAHQLKNKSNPSQLRGLMKNISVINLCVRDFIHVQ